MFMIQKDIFLPDRRNRMKQAKLRPFCGAVARAARLGVPYTALNRFSTKNSEGTFSDLMRRIVWQTVFLKMGLFLAVCFCGFTVLGDWRVTKYGGDELKKVLPYVAYSYETNGCRIVFYDNTKDFKLICPSNKIFNWTRSSQKNMAGRSGCEITVGLYKKGKLVDSSVLVMYDGRSKGEGIVRADINKKRMDARKRLKDEIDSSMTIYKTALDISRVYNCLRTPDCHVRIVAPYFEDVMEMDIVVPCCKDLPIRRFNKRD